MMSIRAAICILVATISYSISHAYVINGEFVDPSVPADSVYHKWASAGSNATIDTLAIREIDITDIEPIVCYNNVTSETDTTTFVSAIPDDDLDDSGCYKALIDFLVLRELNLSEHDIHLKQFPTGIYLCRVSFGNYESVAPLGLGRNSFLYGGSRPRLCHPRLRRGGCRPAGTRYAVFAQALKSAFQRSDCLPNTLKTTLKSWFFNSFEPMPPHIWG